MSSPPPLPPSNPYAAPTARIEDIPQGDLVLADRGIRLVATIVDGLTVAGIGILAAIAMPLLMPRGGGEPNEALMAVVYSIVFLAMLGVLILNMIWLHRYGQTIGKRLFNIKVLQISGEHCPLWRIILLRWLPVTLLGAIPLVGIVVSLLDPLMIFRNDQRCLHDLIAGTIVVKA